MLYALVIFLFAAQAAWSQPNAPHIGYAYPAGGRQGDTFQVTIGGQYLESADNVYISGGGVQAKVIESIKLLTPKEVNDLREKLQELQKKPREAETVKEMLEIRTKLNDVQNKRANPVLAEKVILQITMAPDTEPGQRELRLATSNGLSNPLFFHVGQLAEFSKKEAKNSGNPLNGRGPAAGGQPRSTGREPEMTITLPAIINGQTMPGGVDRYRFQARKGQRLVVAVSARELIPYLADAVPGWFQAAVALYDSNGNELAYDDHYLFHPDPVLYCKIPKDGQYVLEIRDALYRGREDFVYRISVGELPFVTSVFPLGGPAGTETVVELKGWNLPVQKLTMDARDKEPGIIPLSIRRGEVISNIVPFAVDTLPEYLEQEPNDDPASAQQVTLPIIVNGRIDKPGDWDVFRFDGRKGQEIVADVDARKLDSPLDSVLKLTDADGRQLAFNDDYGDKGTGLSTHHADSYLTAVLPANGAYYLYLGDAQHKGGPEYGYRLRISEPRPDFALRVVPSSVNLRTGASVPITVYCLRKDGFSGEITLALKDAPKGFALSGASVPANKDQMALTLKAPQSPLEEPCNLSIEGRATIQGREVVRQAVPAEDMMQAFIYHHLVPEKNLLVSVIARGRPRAPLNFIGESPVKLPAGGTASLKFSLPRGPMFENVQLALNNPPEGISVQNASPAQESLTLLLHADADKVKSGQKGNLIIEASAERIFNPGGGTQPANKRRVSLGTLPAIPFEIVK
ncbi:MAG: PPC domain-containing protein [Thermoguttaceae bacterium]